MPQGYVGDRRLRAVRDLLRRRASLVARRTALSLSLRNLQMRTRGNCPISTVHMKKALGCKIAKTVWYILTHGSEYDGERLFGPEKNRGTAQANHENFGRASTSQNKGLKT